MEFQVGDKVHYKTSLIVYTVGAIKNGRIRVVEDTGWWKKSSFKLARKPIPKSYDPQEEVVL